MQGMAYESENWIMRPFFDHPIQFRPSDMLSDLFSMRTTFAGSSAVYDLATLHTRRSPLCVCVASMSDLCRDDEACHASVTIGEGVLDVDRLWMMVNRGWRVAMRRDPFWYLRSCEYGVWRGRGGEVPNALLTQWQRSYSRQRAPTMLQQSGPESWMRCARRSSVQRARCCPESCLGGGEGG